jgi:hypothetical protein
VNQTKNLYAGGLYSGPFAEAAARRYEQIWLPLLAATAAKSEAEAGELVPPLDVAYAWLCHRLAPAAYEADCKRLFGRTLDPLSSDQALAFDDGTNAKGAAAKQAWANNKGARLKGSLYKYVLYRTHRQFLVGFCSFAAGLLGEQHYCGRIPLRCTAQPEACKMPRSACTLLYHDDGEVAGAGCQCTHLSQTQFSANKRAKPCIQHSC